MLTGPKQGGSTESKLNNLRITNWILPASVIIALVSILLGLIQNRRLSLDKKQLQLQLQISAHVAPCDSTRPGDIVPPIEAYTSEGKKVEIAYNGSSRYLLFIFQSNVVSASGSFPTGMRFLKGLDLKTLLLSDWRRRGKTFPFIPAVSVSTYSVYETTRFSARIELILFPQ